MLLHRGVVRMGLRALLDRLGGILGRQVLLDRLGGTLGRQVLLVRLDLLVHLDLRDLQARIHLAFLVHHCCWDRQGLLVHLVHLDLPCLVA